MWEQNTEIWWSSAPGIRIDQLHRVVENRDRGNPDTVVIRVGTNDARRAVNLYYMMVEVYAL
jgi:hypothetical protein